MAERKIVEDFVLRGTEDHDERELLALCVDALGRLRPTVTLPPLPPGAPPDRLALRKDGVAIWFERGYGGAVPGDDLQSTFAIELEDETIAMATVSRVPELPFSIVDDGRAAWRWQVHARSAAVGSAVAQAIGAAAAPYGLVRA